MTVTDARGLDLDQLRTFVVVVETGSMSAAAPRLFLSQSAVSEQVRKLEERCGASLLSRGKKGVATTPAGARLLGHARDMLALSEAALMDLRGQTLKGEIRLAVTDYFRPSDIAQMLQRLRGRYPELRLHVAILKSAEIDGPQADGEVFDLGLSMRLAPSGRGRRRERAPAAQGGILVRRESLEWVTAEGARGPLARPIPLVVLPGGCSLRQFVVQTLERRHLPYEIAHSASGVAGLQLAIIAGLGVSCLNRSAIAPGMAPCAASERLPALPEVEFRLLPERRGERACVTQARLALAAMFS